MEHLATHVSTQQIAHENIANLYALWRAYGCNPLYENEWFTLWRNTGWPHRCWFEMNSGAVNNIALTPDVSESISRAVSALLLTQPQETVFPVYPLQFMHASIKPTANLTPLIQQCYQGVRLNTHFTQQAMILNLTAHKATSTYDRFSPPSKHGMRFVKVSNNSELNVWCNIASAAFGYTVDKTKVQPLMGTNNITITLGFKGNKPAATGLLLKTKHTVGIHQVGVLPALQGQGVATAIMHNLLASSVKQDANYAVLQASDAGAPLYRKLGFCQQFAIRNCVRA